MSDIKLGLQYYSTNPPKPSRIIAIVGGKEVGEISLAEFEKMETEIREMWNEYNGGP